MNTRADVSHSKAALAQVQGPNLPPWPPLGNQPAAAKAEGPPEVDARGLEPPEPMLRILSAVEGLAAGGVLRARTDRRPLHLLSELEARGVSHECQEQADGSWIITLRRG